MLLNYDLYNNDFKKCECVHDQFFHNPRKSPI